MLKPCRSAAGRGIRVWDETAASEFVAGGIESHYFQQRSTGIPCSGLYLINAAGTHRIGFSRQFIGEPALNATGYKYCGSLGPIELPSRAAQVLDAIATGLTSACELRGLFGLDFLLEGDIPLVTEVNPRYTASVEIYEAAFDVPLLRHHAAAFESQPIDSPTIPAHSPSIVAKAILFAADECVTPPLHSESLSSFCPEDVRLADIPSAGSRIAQGHPVCSILARAGDQGECLDRLNSALQALSMQLFRRASFPVCAEINFEASRSSSSRG